MSDSQYQPPVGDAAQSDPAEAPAPAQIPAMPPAAPVVPGAPQFPGAQQMPGAPQAPAEWAWAKPPVAYTTRETEPLEYHRLLRGTRKYRWWRPLLLLVLSGVYFGVGSLLIGFMLAPIMMAVDPTYVTDMMSGDAEILDTQRPISVLFAMMSIIVMLPSVLLAMLTLGMRPVGRIWSVAGRIRWGIVWRSTLIAVLAVVVMNGVGIAVEMLISGANGGASASGGAESGAAPFNMTNALISLAIVIVLVPIQSTAEEVVFRGLFMQVLGSWLRFPWFAIIIPSVAFAFGHIYDIWGLLAVGLMGLVAAWLTWKTGGLEAAIAIHVINNLFAFSMMTFAVGGSTAQTENAGGVGNVVGEAAGLAVFAWLVVWMWKRGGYGRTRIDVVEVPVAAGGPGVGYAAGVPAGQGYPVAAQGYPVALQQAPAPVSQWGTPQPQQGYAAPVVPQSPQSPQGYAAPVVPQQAPPALQWAAPPAPQVQAPSEAPAQKPVASPQAPTAASGDSGFTESAEAAEASVAAETVTAAENAGETHPETPVQPTPVDGAGGTTEEDSRG